MSPLKRFVLIALVLSLILVALLFWIGFRWFGLGDGGLSFHGYLAMGLGALFTLLMGIGLMALSFHSNRSGHDDMTSEISAAPLSSHQDGHARRPIAPSAEDSR